MDNLVRLQLLNMFKKYDYLRAELDVKSEVSAICQGVFWENIERVVGGDERLSGLASSVRPDPTPPAPSVPPTDFPEQATVDRSEELRSLYRSVAKLTHPDRVSNEYLNAVYLEAARCVRENDEIGMWSISVRLGLVTEVPERLVGSLTGLISELEGKIRFLESSYHMRWHYSDRDRKVELVCEYIERNLLRLSEA